LSLTQVRLVGSVDAKRSVGLPNAGEPDSITAFSRISDLGFRTMVRPSDEVDPWNRGRCARGARPVGIPSAAPMTSTGRRFVNATPTMLTAKDDELLGVANRSDAMGLLAVWAVRGRDLVPHLTEQTTSVRGFQILVEAFRLWEHYEPAHPQHAGRLVDFFLLVEQAFARTVGWRDQEWGLPGARRVRARSTEAPHISLVDTEWHLLGSQRATGLWGLYRGASRRAGLLLDDMTRLSGETMDAATAHAGIGPTAQARLFELLALAMGGRTVPLRPDDGSVLTRDLYDTYWKIPLADHLHARLIDGHPLNRQLAERLVELDHLNRRTILADAADELPLYRPTLRDVARCEDLLAVVEGVFLWLCASKGKSVQAAVADLAIDLTALGQARGAFAHSGTYRGDTAIARQERLRSQLDTSDKVALARSVLQLHEEVSKERGRAPWVWEDQGLLISDVEVERPTEVQLQVGVAWRNDYYLHPLQEIAKQLARVRQ
jgi:hypothetical protein